jgi:hypothetical protein
MRVERGHRRRYYRHDGWSIHIAGPSGLNSLTFRAYLWTPRHELWFRLVREQ